MKRNDLYAIIFLCTITIIIFSPLFNAEYLFTDEADQLWLYRKNSGYEMFFGQGRGITEKIFQELFGRIHTIKDVSYLRMFSFLGWLLCIPVWYTLLEKTVRAEGLPGILTFFSMVYLVTMPAFSIYVGWASVMEIFIANTSGLLSGYVLYNGLRNPGKLRMSIAVIVSVLFGCISLFTYQNGFGCFLLPFFLHFIAKQGISKKVLIAIAVYFLIYIIYYFLFKLSLSINNLAATERTSLHIDVFRKCIFLIRALTSSFHFTFLFNEKNIPGLIVSAVVFGFWFIVAFRQRKNIPVISRLIYFVSLFCFFGLLYLPSLVVKENYASNRTLFALNLAVFFLVTETVLAAIRQDKTKQYAVALLSVLFIINAWYNFNRQFLEPQKKEYSQVRKYIENNYSSNTDTVWFIRPQEDFFVKKYGIIRSWDEFGVPSTFFDWTPEFFVRQIVFEKTGSRSVATKLVIKSWLGNDEFIKSGSVISQNTLVIDTERIMNAE
ncbi:MAG: hypothetical protein ABUT20_05440 [Bacteroidota bacterium]